MRVTMLVVLLSLVAACGGAEEADTAAAEPTAPPVETTEPPTPEPASEPASAPTSGMPAADVTVTAVNYAYEDLPDAIPAGSTVGLDNQGTEPHELVAFFIPAAETRTLEELLALPEDEEPPIEFAGVAVATTDGAVFYPEGAVTLQEPGRYAFVCFLPVGITDQQIRQIAEETGPGEDPSFPEGPPHFTRGMWAEVTVG